jgi:hypothetical protein
MRRIFLSVVALITIFKFVAAAKDLSIQPTTTLRAQTANNTSAANNFNRQTNGNAGAGNISKLDVRSLLYPGARTKFYAHLMTWFGGSNHMNVGYNSADPAQVKRQVQDMMSRGIDGVIIDWYGKGTLSDQATLQVMKEAEKYSGFTFAIMVDHGAIERNSCSGCSPQQALVHHLEYAEQNYFDSPAYMRIEGRPVVTNFDIDLSYAIDWKAAEHAIASDPVFIFQSNSGFTHVLSGGSYSWVKPTTTDYGASYLTSFYQTGKSYPHLFTVGASYKGFNDKLAAWSKNRVMDQQCGQTWLRTFARINQLYNSGHQLDALQLVTWNDYEEGTEIESGIDNCVSMTANVSGKALKWKISGNENTIDHYQVYISKDGQNLMPLTAMNAGLSSLNLCSFSLAKQNYKLFVQAVGKPSIKNQITSAIAYKPQCDDDNNDGNTNSAPPPSSGGPSTGTKPTIQLVLQANPSSLKVGLGKSSTATVSLSAQSGSIKAPIRFECSDLPFGMSCSFSPAVARSGKMTSTLSIATTVPASALVHDRGHKKGIVYACLLTLGMVGFVGIGQINRNAGIKTIMILALMSTSFLISSCGVAPSKVQSGSSYSITVTGRSADAKVSSILSVSVE